MSEHATVSAFLGTWHETLSEPQHVIVISQIRSAVSSFYTEASKFLTATSTVFQELPRAEMPEEWSEEEYREAYMLASIEQGVAWQIRVNREGRDLSQTQLAQLIGTRQSSISRWEDPEYGNHTIPTLVKLANAFKCALSVKFIPYSQLAIESEDLSPRALFAAPFDAECTRVECMYDHLQELEHHETSPRKLS